MNIDDCKKKALLQMKYLKKNISVKMTAKQIFEKWEGVS